MSTDITPSWDRDNPPRTGYDTVFDPALGAHRALTHAEAQRVADAEARQARHPDVDLGDPYDGIEIGLSRAADDAARSAQNPTPTREQRLWTAAESEAYLDSRPVGGPYDPAAEYGDPGWREPESQDEADARTAHLATLPTSPAPRVALTEVEDAYVDATRRAVDADVAHDPDPEAWAEARRLEALGELRSLPDEPEPDIEPDQLEADELGAERLAAEREQAAAEMDRSWLDEIDAADPPERLGVDDESSVAVVDRESLIFDPAAEGGFRTMTDDEHDRVIEQVRASQPTAQKPEPEPEDEELEP